MTLAGTAAVAPGFADPVFDAQSVFRALLRAMSFPGRIEQVIEGLEPPTGLDAAQAALSLALADRDTPVWLDAAAGTDAARAFLRFHCGCRLVEAPGEAAFALIGDAAAMPALDAFDAGTDLYPDASATLLLRLPALKGGEPLSLTGPGVATRRTIAPAGLPAGFRAAWAANNAIYPTGVDLVLTCGADVLALPRSVELEG